MEQTGPICIVDDEQSIRETLEAVLKDEGYKVVSSPNAEHFERSEERRVGKECRSRW